MIKYSKEDVLKKLDNKMVLYADLVGIGVVEETVEFSYLDSEKHDNLLLCQAKMNDTVVEFEKRSSLFLRSEVIEKIELVLKSLKERKPRLKMKVVYGYRELDIQQKLFDIFLNKFSSDYTGSSLLEQVHKFIAVPEVSGHPTGGAIDVCLTDENGIDLNYGSAIWTFTKSAYTFNPFVSYESWMNRMFLRQLFLQQGFAPFDGEWWHFSYGDKEWAYYYGKINALYKQKSALEIESLKHVIEELEN